MSALVSIREFMRLGAAGGIVLMVAAVLAMLMANSPLAWVYDHLLNMPVEVRVGPLEVAKPLLLWINDGLMAVFFFLVGLELKKEVIEGALVDKRQIVLPVMGAVGGMAIPALVYVGFNWGDPTALQGWAIPAATDIAFALGVLSLLGSRVPASLKLLLVSVAIFDDMGAIVIIALFYTSELSVAALFIALSCLLILFTMNRRGVSQITPYMLVGIVMWLAVLKSGVHATLAGVALAMFIPMRDSKDASKSPVINLEHDLRDVVAFGILPIFAFANAGISLEGVGLDTLMHPVPLGIAAGLFIGKQLGVFGFFWMGVKLGWAQLPEGTNWMQLYGLALISGIGFTMSLFIGSLAFENTGGDRFFDERLGIIVGSLLSAVAGYWVLRFASAEKH
ncbi:MAG: NhaA family Na+:H+ antiporter [Gammaproteobacteria bacterium]|jgi:NhaA family Na+:H+ antiporter